MQEEDGKLEIHIKDPRLEKKRIMTRCVVGDKLPNLFVTQMLEKKHNDAYLKCAFRIVDRCFVCVQDSNIALPKDVNIIALSIIYIVLSNMCEIPVSMNDVMCRENPKNESLVVQVNRCKDKIESGVIDIYNSDIIVRATEMAKLGKLFQRVCTIVELPFRLKKPLETIFFDIIWHVDTDGRDAEYLAASVLIHCLGQCPCEKFDNPTTYRISDDHLNRLCAELSLRKRNLLTTIKKFSSKCCSISHIVKYKL